MILLTTCSISGCCDRVTSECCNRVSVEYTEKNEAFERFPSIYTSYVIEKGMINGRNHYTSVDGTRAIVNICNSWNVQDDSDR